MTYKCFLTIVKTDVAVPINNYLTDYKETTQPQVN